MTTKRSTNLQVFGGRRRGLVVTDPASNPMVLPFPDDAALVLDGTGKWRAEAGGGGTPGLHASTHENGGSDEINVGGLSGLLADPQTPLGHHASHELGGGDAIKLDDLSTPDDNTDLNASTTKHGLLRKLDNSATHFLDGQGAWSTPDHGSLGGLTDDDHAQYTKADGTRAFTGDQSMGSHKLTNVTDPASAQDAATKAYVDALAVNLGKRATVRVATTAAITIATALNNGDTLDGVALVTGDLVLVKDQAAPEQNGVYVVGVSPARDAQFDTYNEHAGSLITVQEGTANADTLWLCTSNVGGTLNTTAIAFSGLSVSAAITQLTGDVTAGPGSGSQAATIAADAVTFAKLQNIATDSLIGRDTAGAGDPENITLNATLEMDGSAHLQRAALTGDVTAAAGANATTIANDAVTNAKAANMAQATLKGRAVGAGTGDPTDLTPTQATAILDAVVGDSGAGGTKGLAPAPGAGDAAAGKFLKADGTYAVPPGTGTPAITQLTGDVTAGPGSGSQAATLAASGVAAATYGDATHVAQVTFDAKGRATAAAAVAITFPAQTTRYMTVGLVIDGAGSTISTGIKGYVRFPSAGTIVSATLLSIDSAPIAGSIVIDIWKDTLANWPPTVADTITASAKPTLSTATSYEDTTLTGWTTAVAAGDVFGFKVDSASGGITKVILELKVQLT